MSFEKQSGKLIIHIGPPKTGSTSLQYFMQGLKRTNIYYCGAFQPRKHNQDSIAHQLYRYCKDPKQQDNKVRQLRAAIAAKLAKYDYVFISEEMFSLQTQKSTWQDKLIRLYKVVGHFAPHILFFIRDIKDVLPSYYQEIYRMLPKNLQNDFLLFEKSNYALAYNYKFLLQKIESYGYRNICHLHFSKLIKSEYCLSHILCDKTIQDNCKVLIEAKNRGKVKNGTRVLEKKHPLEMTFDKLSRILPKAVRGKGLLMPFIKRLRAMTRQEKKLKVSGHSRDHYETSLQYLKEKT